MSDPIIEPGGEARYALGDPFVDLAFVAGCHPNTLRTAVSYGDPLPDGPLVVGHARCQALGTVREPFPK